MNALFIVVVMFALAFILILIPVFNAFGASTLPLFAIFGLGCFGVLLTFIIISKRGEWHGQTRSRYDGASFAKNQESAMPRNFDLQKMHVRNQARRQLRKQICSSKSFGVQKKSEILPSSLLGQPFFGDWDGRMKAVSRPKFSDAELSFILQIFKEAKRARQQQAEALEAEKQRLINNVQSLSLRLFKEGPYSVCQQLKMDRAKLAALGGLAPNRLEKETIVLADLIRHVIKIQARQGGHVPHRHSMYWTYLRELGTWETQKKQKPQP
jgi:hypothetical protein